LPIVIAFPRTAEAHVDNFAIRDGTHFVKFWVGKR
jgi:hypothetical protein